MSRYQTLRSVLDRLYTASGVVAALFLIAILTLILLQMLARWTGEVFPGAPDYAGYSMAAASFFAFAHALNHGAHIRVSILLNAMGTKGRRIIEVWCFSIATALAWYFCFYAIKTVWWSYKLGDISQGQDATPIWIPQMVMVIGAIIFAIALTDNLLHVLFTGRHRMKSNVIEQSHGE